MLVLGKVDLLMKRDYKDDVNDVSSEKESDDVNVKVGLDNLKLKVIIWKLEIIIYMLRGKIVRIMKMIEWMTRMKMVGMVKMMEWMTRRKGYCLIWIGF